MSFETAGATISVEEGCDGVCTETSDLLGVVMGILSGFALVVGLMSSLVSSWTNYLAKAFRQRDSVAKEQTYPPGRDPFYLIYSLQYVATILATDRGQIPESLRHYADKFQWAIFQIKFGDNSNLRKTCDIEVRDQLFGTAVVCSIIFFGSFLLRECARFLIGKWSRGQIGIRNSPGFLCLGHWELVWFLIMSFGWSISAGKAIRSDCVGWEIIGITILIFLPFTGLCICHFMIKFAVEWEPVAIFERSKDHPAISTIVDLSHLYLPLHGHAGRWKMLPGTNWPNFLQVFSKYIEVFRKDLYYYGSYVLLKKICTGLVYAVPKPSTAAILLCIVNVVEALTLVLTQPHVEFKLYLRGALQSVVMLIVAALLVAHAHNECSDAALTLTTVVVTFILLIVAIVDQLFTASQELGAAMENTKLISQPHPPFDLPDRLLRVRSEDGNTLSPHKTLNAPRSESGSMDAELLMQGVHERLRETQEESWGRGSIIGGREEDGARRRGSTQPLAISSMPAAQGTASLARRLQAMDVGFEVNPRPGATGGGGVIDRRHVQNIRERLVAMGHWYNPVSQLSASAYLRT
mmetsp:Transcript_59406/g.139966  ORF Transcript_59406/g.139966 Transcript_59406/m.139966 type:complete len:578 (+) Transcript_59406:183-1916(+)